MHENRNLLLFLIEINYICTAPDTFYQYPGQDLYLAPVRPVRCFVTSKF